MRVDHAVEISRSPGEVYGYLADPGNLVDWQEGLSEVRRNGKGPASVGDRWTEIRTAMGRRVEATVEVVEAEPARRFTVSSTAGPVRFRVEHALEPYGAGTRVSIVADGEQRGVMRLAAPMVARQVREGFTASFARLKALLEAEE